MIATHVSLVAAASGGHEAALAPILLALAVILAAAKFAGSVAIRLGQPAVLGELVAGIALGNLHLVGIGALDGLEGNATLEVLAGLGVIILLFEVGLESTVRDMLKVGWPSLFVAVLGVVAPFALGWLVGVMLLPDRSPYVHAFLGATLTATSVGITARVLKDLGRSDSSEARVILGAAVIDDVLGLVILAVVAGVIGAADAGGSLSALDIGWILAKAVGFLGGALAIGLVLSPKLFGIASRLRGHGVLLATALVFCFGLAYLASLAGLAALVGAYAAGLVLERVHYRELASRENHELEQLIHPIASLLVPVFFVLMGTKVGLEHFASTEILLLAALLTVAAVLGKQVCALGAFGGGLDRLTIGLGMIPRGEVGLIFASIGLGLSVRGEPIVDAGIYSAVVIMVVITTMATPPALKWSLGRRYRR
ncbi:MAG: cation:proton antiporter [Planctomycetota bacterium]|nr:MAG: cation:proton antiporter [Planctomycetota bacterium]